MKEKRYTLRQVASLVCEKCRDGDVAKPVPENFPLPNAGWSHSRIDPDKDGSEWEWYERCPATPVHELMAKVTP